ncbi:hypothetical protein [Leptodesmis sp.]|uniref:hypothetical protein n=1 Tax=Leptodesmis sp. TaxID=3100501 RepID=UPI0040535628
MHTTIATLGTFTILLSFVSLAQAQSEPIGSANSLQGLQERTIQQSAPSRTTTGTASVNGVQNSSNNPLIGLPIDRNVQLRVRPEVGTSQVGVFPVDDNSRGSQFQLIYQFDDQPTNPNQR